MGILLTFPFKLLDRSNNNHYSIKGFVFYGVTFDLCRFCTFLNLAQPAKGQIISKRFFFLAEDSSKKQSENTSHTSKNELIRSGFWENPWLDCFFSKLTDLELAGPNSKMCRICISQMWHHKKQTLYVPRQVFCSTGYHIVKCLRLIWLTAS